MFAHLGRPPNCLLTVYTKSLAWQAVCGRDGLWVEFAADARVTVIEPRFVAGLPDEQAALAAALCSLEFACTFAEGSPQMCKEFSLYIPLLWSQRSIIRLMTVPRLSATIELQFERANQGDQQPFDGWLLVVFMTGERT
jgi:hypothetical protein